LIPLSTGDNLITTTITSQDGSTTKTYTVTITRAVASADATLAGLGLSNGALSPVFSSGINTYLASVTNAVSNITITPSAANASAAITIGGTRVVSGSGLSIPLNLGDNLIGVTITAADGTTTKTYTITVNRAAPSADATLAGLSTDAGTISPVFNTSTTSYAISVSNAVSSITLSPFSNETNAIVLVNGTQPDVASGTFNIPLNEGSNVIATVVTAQDGTTSKTYTLTVTRAASISGGAANATLASFNISGAILKSRYNR